MKALDPRLIEAGLSVLQEKGVRFTMDDLSRKMGISKKTVYELVDSKEALIDAILDASHASIRDQQAEVIRNPAWEPLEKLERILTVLPALTSAFDYGRLAELEERYPALFAKMQRLLDEGWETTLDVFRAGVEEGRIRPVQPELFKLMYTSAVTALFHDRFVLRQGLPYAEALRDVVCVLLHGLATPADT